MKLTRIISLLLVFVMLMLTFASCNLFGPATEESTSETTPGTEDSTSSTSKNPDENPEPEKDDWDDLYDIISIAEAIEIAKAETSTNPTTRYYVRGTITKVTNPAYGEMTITDGVNEIYVYGTYSADGSIGYASFTDKPYKGDEVLFYCTLNTYEGTPQIKNARLIDFKKADKGEIDVSEYAEMTIAEAREAAVDTKVLISGTVARITYATGMKPSGAYIVDETNSIYIYDADLASQVKIGNKITVLGSKTYWILSDEQNNANKFGYGGCCQIEDAVLYENDNASNDIDFSWCEEKSVKDILEIPVTENVTTTIFKTNALVKKVPGNGFTNYYFFDLDGNTGAYTYTQNNGNDFSWLDKFDGKICTVYLSPMNAKSTASDCFFRFLPIEVIDEGFLFDPANAPMHVVEYYCTDQFLPEYTGNPLKELPASVSSELLGFDNVTVTYTSDNESVVYFTVNTPGTVTLNCGENGTATVTITATYGDYSYSDTVEITVSASTGGEGLTVEEAIATAVGEKIKVEGIVGPSIVNQSGFYLIDETGAIAVRVAASEFEGLAIGQKVLIEGTVTITKDGGGQFCLDSATVVSNQYGKVDYSSDSFITDKTFEEVIATPDSPAATTQVYVITAKVKLVDATYYSNIYLTNGTTDFILYCNKSSQYGFLSAYDGQEVTIEFALCDWNAKGLKGAVLAIITDDGKIYNELNFTTN